MMMNNTADPKYSGLSIARLVFSGLVAGIAVAAYLLSMDFARGARLFPQAVSILVFGLAVASMIVTVWQGRKAEREEDDALETSDLTSDTAFKEVWPYLIWVMGAYLGMYLIGFFPAAGLFCLLFLWRVARMKWLGNIAMTALCLVTVLALGVGLNISWPRGLLPLLLA
ncbi:tripartite tricarboxylate transporter TctB family protein [Pelagibacterium sp.]|uniref:tripartite tricarboxylate transporter TctB family protein n=1 Tax=Pelagibacterium sp. TaxID=1967288 RepID=UPI003BA90DB1